MASRRALTGGSMDVNPQLMSFSITQSGLDSTTSVAIPIPIQRLPQGRGAQVLEVLWVDYECSPNEGTGTSLTTHR